MRERSCGDSALPGLGLKHDLIRARAVVEEVDEGRAGRPLIVSKKALGVTPNASAFDRSNSVDQIRAGEDRGKANLRQLRVLFACGEDLIADLIERRQAEVVDVFDLDCEAAGRAQAGNRRRVAGIRREVRNLQKLLVEIVLHRERRVLHAVPFGERLELQKHRRLIRAVVGKTEADARRCRLDLRHLEHHVFEPSHRPRSSGRSRPESAASRGRRADSDLRWEESRSA